MYKVFACPSIQIITVFHESYVENVELINFMSSIASEFSDDYTDVQNVKFFVQEKIILD